jgi:predicted kinase
MAAPEREPIVSMVRYHGYPIMFLEKQDPERAVATACASCDPRLLAMVAKFDARGRKISFGRAARKEEMESRAQFFHEVALGLLACPMSAHSRFLYFHTGKPAYDAYDDSRAEAIVMSGLPGAGKDTWIRRNGAGMPTVSLDNIRYEMDVDPDDNQGHVVAAAKEMARGLLRQGRPFIWNATNVSKMIRHGLISLFWSYKYRTKIIYVEAPWDEVMRRNQAREKIVPRKILEHLLGRLEVPDKTEAHEVAWTS